MAKMSEAELGSLVDARISESRQYDQSDLRAHRSWAIRFYDGEVDIPEQPGRSKVVSSDVADVMGWTMPSLLRVFTASEKIAIYEPNTPEDEAGAKQATDGINFIFLNECEGYRVILETMHNGLLHGNGPGKAWWEGAPEYKVEKLTGLTEEEAMAIASEPDMDDIMDVREYMVGPDGNEIEGEQDASY